VPGVSVTDYCDERLLDTEERLKIFVTICEALQHAHQKGIIHRDIKPSNILVFEQDGKPFLKVIDFGIAKAVNQPAAAHTAFTLAGRLLGTPEYMSPEQANLTDPRVDTATDIYSLGVLLYEMLAGALPFEGKSLREAGLAELLRIIREVVPPTVTAGLTFPKSAD
jgi:eukaryotic-like serine/threonine-protein kinase